MPLKRRFGCQQQSQKVRMAAVILASGKGSRLKSLDLAIPKALISVGGSSLLSRSVSWVKSSVSTVVVASGTKTKNMKQDLGALGDQVVFSEDHELGTGDSLFEALDKVNADHLIVCNADTLNQLNLTMLVKAHLTRGRGATIALTRRADAQNAKAFAVTRDGQVLRSIEDLQPLGRQPLSELWRGASTGVFIIPTVSLKDKRLARAVSLEQEIIPHIIDTDGLYAFDNGESFCLDVGTPERYRFLRRNEAKILKIL